MPLSKERNKERMRQARVQPKIYTHYEKLEPKIYTDYGAVQPKPLPNCPDGRYRA